MKKLPDFHRVAPEHKWVDEQLNNWARWCRDSHGIRISPGFELYAPDNYDRAAPKKPCDVNAALKVQDAIRELSVSHRKAIQWHYVHPVSPARRARELKVSTSGLNDLVNEARTILDRVLTRTMKREIQYATA